ncbi:polysaccharide biosynthesis C-terminal domain-containing protein [Pseudoalteromonas ardens]|uniref:oligosaccharide flippase family protein n=1 Tax=Pseudoalteromonas ardens TaxID=3048490 RepID=UPI0024C244C6|nr:polysaccharide biosynthesis C-terminal domain-containing protein [Pseudoalteromonas sp. R96]MDK1310860.1 polysaccharide biosynthesis C-terminal domain-containing protein [Pseudoalteromonas sp. R96]
MQQDKYLKQGALTLCASVIIGFLADYAFNLSLSRTLSAHEYGDYKVAYAYATICGVLALLGGDRVAPKFLAKPLANKATSEVGGFVIFFCKIAAGISFVLFSLAYLSGYLHLGSWSPDEHHALLWISAAIPLIAVGAMLSRVLQSAKLLIYANLPWRIVLPVGKTLAILLLASSLDQVHLWQVIIAGIAILAIITTSQLFILYRKNLLTLSPVIPVRNQSQLLATSIPMMLAMLVTIAISQLDLYMLELLALEHEVGHYAGAVTTSHMIPVAQVSVIALFVPLLGQALERGEEYAERVLWQGQRVMLVIILILTVGLLISGAHLLQLFGKDFFSAHDALKYLILGSCFWAVTAFVSTWLQYTGRGKYVVIIGLLTLVTDAVLNWLLIPIHGITGAAIATCIALCVASLLTWSTFIICRKRSYSSATIQSTQSGHR